MENALNNNSSWTTLGRLPGGSISALAVGQAQPEVLFAGTPVGLYRLAGSVERNGWERLDKAPMGVLALAVSPGFATDRTLFASDKRGVWRSTDGGDTWQLAKMPTSNAQVLSMAVSPGFSEDGTLLAGTLENGVIISNDRGETWTSRSSGVLDPMVMCIGFSPDFTNDGIALAGTDSGLFITSNRVRAWKRVAIPGGVTPVISLAVSSNFAHDYTLFIGTEANGVFRSRDRGKTVQQLPLPPGAVNALLIPGSGTDLYAACEDGIYCSTDQGETWVEVQKVPDVISLAAAGDRILAGAVDEGLWIGDAEQHWQQVTDLPVRGVIGLALSNGFKQDHTSFMAGPQEGVWRTRDSGTTWEAVNDTLSSWDVASLAISPQLNESSILAVATNEGVFVSEDGGENWRSAANDAANQVAFSSSGGLLAASFPGQGLRTTTDLGASWLPLEGPWVEEGGQVISLAVSDEGHFHVAYLGRGGTLLSVWHGEPGRFERVVHQPASENQVVPFWCPPAANNNFSWYLAVEQVILHWTTRWSASPMSVQPRSMPPFLGLAPGDTFLDIAGVREGRQDHLFATTQKSLYHAVYYPGGEYSSWILHDFGPDRAIKIAPSSTYLQDHTLYVLLVGGIFAKVVVE